MKNKSPGFTLIELSIVLVIIGLIVGGVLTGRDLIEAASIRKTITEKDQIDAAVNTFRVKYNCIPGDCTNGTTFGFAANGNGDGNLTCNLGYGGGCVDGESLFWESLVDSKLLGLSVTSTTNAPCTYAIPGYNTPKTILGQMAAGDPCSANQPAGGWWVYDSDTMAAMDYPNSSWPYPAGWRRPTWKSYALLIDPWGPSARELLTPNQMRQIDQKIDDGFPMTGSVRAILTYKYSSYVPDGVAVSFNNPSASHNNCATSNSLTAPYSTADDVGIPGWYACDLIMQVGW